MSTLQVTDVQASTVKNPNTTAGGVAIDSSGHVQVDGVQMPTAGALSNRNKIINGDMRIDQRNAGAAVTLTAANFVYPVDRFFAFRASGTSGATAQQVSGSITGGNALRVQRTSGNAATDALGFGQVIESADCAGFAGNNITLSFRARCGANFSAASSQITARVGIGNGTDQSSANFYNAAWTGQSNTNTLITLTTSWQTFTVAVAAGSSVNQAGIQFYWTPSGTAGADDWVEIEQIQLEVGEKATPFEHRSYGDELARCQRYYQKSYAQDTAPGTNTSVGRVFTSCRHTGTAADYCSSVIFPVTMRALPSNLYYSQTGTLGVWSSNATNPTVGVNSISQNGFAPYGSDGSSAGTAGFLYGHYTADAEL